MSGVPVSLYTPEYVELRRRLKQAREDAGLTQEQAAAMLGEGWNQELISYIETARRHVYALEIVKFSDIYEKPIDWFLRGHKGDL